MPLARIDIPVGKSADYGKTVGGVVYDTMVSVLNVPQNDRFQVIGEHQVGTGLIADPNYLGVNRSENVLFVQLTLNEGRSVEAKQAFYKALADGLNARLGLRREDLVINLVEVKKENWSFGNGIAQYV